MIIKPFIKSSMRSNKCLIETFRQEALDLEGVPCVSSPLINKTLRILKASQGVSHTAASGGRKEKGLLKEICEYSLYLIVWFINLKTQNFTVFLR